MKIFQHYIELQPPGPDGTLASRTADQPVIGMTFLSTDSMSSTEVLSRLAASYEFGFGQSTTMVEAVDGDPSAFIGQAIEMQMKNERGIVDGAVPDRDDARMNELEHDLRLQGRQLNSIAAMLQQLTQQLTGAPPPHVSTGWPATPSAPAIMPAAAPSAPVELLPMTQQQQLAASKGFPLIGTPASIGGDPTMSTNPNARGGGRTPEMASGQMGVQGPSPTSTMLFYEGKKDPEGNPIFTKMELPKVGTSLKTGTQMSDIKVGG